MTIVHCEKDIKTSEFIFSQKRQGIPSNSAIETTDNNQALFISIRKYNKHMGGSDVIAQCKSYYLTDTPYFCYWWPLFQFLLDASVFNVYNI